MNASKRIVTVLAIVLLAAHPRDMTMTRTSWAGPPDLALTKAFLDAGGGPQDFDAALLVRTLAAAHPGEIAALRARYGAHDTAQFVETFDVAVRYVLRDVRAANVHLPRRAVPSPVDGAALAHALVRAGTLPNGAFDIGYMLEKLVSHPIHHDVMRRLDADPRIGHLRDEQWHVILTRFLIDITRT
jgi:hypothetical protein